VIYILSGVAKSGKTYISEKILKDYGISSFSTDYLMMSLARANPNIGINPDSDDAVVADQLEPYLYEMIKTMVENNKTYLIEGVHFNPPFAQKLISEFKGKLRFVYLGFADIDVSEKIDELNLHETLIENRWYRHFSTKQMIELIEYLKTVSSTLRKESLLREIKYIEVKNIELQQNEIIQELLKK